MYEVRYHSYFTIFIMDELKYSKWNKAFYSYYAEDKHKNYCTQLQN